MTIRRALIEEIPADLNIEDAQRVGEWISDKLKAAGIPRDDAVIALGREHVGLKRMTLPTALDAELPDMTRLAMQRELPFDADTAVIDFVPVERAATNTTVLAVAVPRTVIEFAKNMAKAAGLGIERISLRTMGAAALLNTILDSEFSIVDSGSESVESSPDASNPKSKIQNPKSQGGGALAVDVTGEGVEFCLVSNGGVRFSRAAEVPQPQDQLAVAEAVITETRRTWMSYRIGEDASDVKSAVIMGERRVCEYAAGPVGEMLKISVQVLEEHPLVDPGAAGAEMDRFWPLAGLLLEPSLRGEMIDFARPRKAPDVALRRRVRVYAAAALLIVLLGAGWTFARKDLQSLQLKSDRLKTQAQENGPENARYGRDLYKLKHLNKWDSVHVDWLKHATYLCNISPPPEMVVLDSWVGALEFRGVTYDNKSDKWSADEQLTIVIDGEARDRETADAFRESLTQNSIYNTSTTGADAKGGKRMPFGFTYRLRTTVGTPNETAAATAARKPKLIGDVPAAEKPEPSNGEAAPAPVAVVEATNQ